MARTLQKVRVSEASEFDMAHNLHDFSAIVQRNLEDLFSLAHKHTILSSVPDSTVGVVGDILPVDTGTNQYLYVKFASGWKRFQPS